MKEQIDLEEQIERCRRLRKGLTDEQMRDALEQLAQDYKALLERRKERGFMLRS